MGKIIVDSDILVACYKHDDASHYTAVKLSELIHKKNQFMALNIVVQESTTVISNRMGMNDARRFYSNISHFIDHIIQLDELVEKSAWDILLKQTKKGCSFVDCANIAAVHEYKLNGILSFDAFYPHSARVDETSSR